MQHRHMALAAVAVMVFCAGAAWAEVIYSDTFAGTGNLSGRIPDTSWNGYGWIAQDASLTGSGAVSVSGNRTAYLPFRPRGGGVYTLSTTVTPPSGGTTNWLATGFGGSSNTSGAMHVTGSYGWLLVRDNGGLQVFAGQNTGNLVYSGAGGTGGADNNVVITLDTTGAAWQTSWSVNGTPYGTHTYAATPTITGIGISNIGLAGGTFDNVTLTGTLGSGDVTGLLRYYSMDDNAANAVVTEKAMGIPAAFVGSTTAAQSVAGAVGTGALAVNGGANQYVQLDNLQDISFPANGPFTFAGWVKTTDDGMLFSFRNSGAGNPLVEVGVASGKAFGQIRDDSGAGLQTIGGTTAINNDAWHHVVVQRGNDNLLRVYADGVLEATSGGACTGAITTINQRAMGAELAWGTGNTGGSLIGSLDEMSVWNMALSTAQVRALAQKAVLPLTGGDWSTASNWSYAPSGAAPVLLVAKNMTKAGGLALGSTGEANSLVLGTNSSLTLSDSITASGGGSVTFDGGTLRMNATAKTMGGLTSAYVSTGGARVDTNGNYLTISQPLLHDPALGAAADGGFTKLGNGYVILSGANTYTGGTNIQGGNLIAQNISALGTGAVSVAAGSYVQVWYNTGLNTISNNFVLNGIGLNQGGYTKAALYGDGAAGGAPLYVLNGQITLNATSNVGGHAGNDMLINGKITGAGGLQKGGSSSFNDSTTVTLTNPANDYAGGTVVGSGRLRVGASEVIPHGAGKGGVVVNSGTTFDVGYNETINSLTGSGNVVFSGTLTGPVYFTTDAGTDLSASKTYTHALDFAAGASVATINGVTFLNAGTSGTTPGGATWSWNGGSTASNASTGMVPASGGMHTLLEDFYYNGNTLTLGGLSAGTTYEVRLYNRRWGGDRYQKFTFDEDGAGPAGTILGFDEDGSATPSYIGYRFTAVSDGAGGARPLTVAINARGAATYHFYGLTNEVVPSASLPTLTVGDASSFTFSGAISGAGKLVKQGTGQMILASASSYTGGTDINEGSLRIGSPAALGTGDVTISNGANMLLWWNAGSNTVANNFVLNGLGTVDGKPAIYGDGGGGGFSEYVLSGRITLNATSNLGGNSANHMRVTGQITGPGGLVKGGTRTDENSTLTLSNPANDYAGGTTVNKGTLRLGASQVIPDGAGKGDLTVSAGTSFDLAGFSETINGLNGSGSVVNTGSTGTLTLGNADANGSFGGAISGPTALVKIGAGKQILTGANSYTGGTTVSGGILEGTTAGIRGTIVNDANVTLTGAGTFSGNMSGTGSLSKTAAGLIEIPNDQSYQGGTSITGGGLRINTAGGLGAGGVDVGPGGYLMIWAPSNFTFDRPLTLKGSSGNASYPALSFDGGGGTVTVNSPITLEGDSEVGLGGTSWNNAALAGTVSGPGKLTVDMRTSNAGRTLSIYGNNDYTGGTRLADGRIYLHSATGFGTGPVAIDNGNCVALWVAGNPTIANDFVLNGVGGLQGNGSGQAGEVKAAIYGDGGGSYGGYTLSGQITLNATSDIGGHSGNDVRLSGKVTGPGGLLKTFANTVTLAGSTSNDFAGGTVIRNGTLVLDKSGGAIAIPGNITLGAGSSGGDIWLRMAQANQFAGQASVVRFDNGSNNAKFQLNGLAQTIGGLVSGGSLPIVQNAEAENTGIPAVTLKLDVAAGQEYTFAGHLRDRSGGNAGRLSIEKRGPGTQVFGGGAIGYTGLTEIYEGVIRITSNSGLGAGGHDGNTMTRIFDGAALELAGGITSNEHWHFWGSGIGGQGAVRSLSGDNRLTDSYCLRSNAAIGVDSGSLTFQTAQPEGSFYQEGGSFSLTKVGAGKLVVASPANHGGGTIFKAGTYSVAADNALGVAAGALTFDGGTLQTTANFTLGSARAVAIQSAGGTFDVADATTLRVDNSIGGPGSLNKSGAGTLELGGNNTYGGQTNIRQGTMKLIPSLSAHYSFDSSSAADDSGNGLNGTIGAGVTPVAGIVGGALSFPRTADGHVSVDYSPLFDTGTFTISAWVNPTDKNGTYGILGTRINGENTFDVKVQPTNIHGDIGNGSGWVNTGVDINATDTGSNGQGGNIPAGQWSLVTYVFNGSQALLYLNGDLKRTLAVSGGRLMKPGQSLWIGDDYGPHEPFYGAIDDVYIYRRGLSTAEVQALYQRGLGGAAPSILPSLSPVTVDAGATLDLNGAKQTLGSLAGGGQVLLGGSALTVGANGTSTLFSGQITGTGSLTKLGAGTWTLGGDSSIGGPTTVQAGKLLVDGTLATTGLTVEGGLLGGAGTVYGPVSILAGGSVSAGASPGHLNITQAYQQAGLMIAELDGGIQGVNYDWISVGDTAFLDEQARIRVVLGFEAPHGMVFDILTAANGITVANWEDLIDFSEAQPGQITWTAEIVDLDGTAGNAEALRLSAVPEPATMALLTAGLAGVGGYIRRRRK